jgi:hypothetical protein
MLIRDDRPGHENKPRPANPDRVLYSCSSCSRSHFVALECPTADEAAREAALADGPKATGDKVEAATAMVGGALGLLLVIGLGCAYAAGAF